MLIAYQLRKNWQGDIRVVIPLGPGGEEAPDKERITHLFEEARIHVEEILVVHRTREDFLCDAPLADISIFTCGPDPDFASFRQIVTLTGTTCLFCRDSSEENVLA
jgi:solute carrier family 12 sodium/potassium/chloride transporter 2